MTDPIIILEPLFLFMVFFLLNFRKRLHMYCLFSETITKRELLGFNAVEVLDFFFSFLCSFLAIKGTLYAVFNKT